VTKQSSGEMRREDAKLRLRFKCKLEERICCPLLRHCERSEAIQSAAAEGFWIASLRSQLSMFTNSLIEFILYGEDSDAGQQLRSDD
jgi:hypothetical protein